MSIKTAKKTQTGVRCAVYLRISQNRTEETLATDRQREDCVKLANEKGWTIVAEYCDEVPSSKHVKRPRYDAMVAAFEAGELDAIVCWDLDRLTRQPIQLEHWVDYSEERGLMIVTANGDADLTTDAGRLFARIKVAVAKAEVERKGARHRRANEQRAELGRPGLCRSFGYHQDGTLNEHEAPFVAELYDKALGGMSIRSMTRWMNEHELKTCRGNAWDRGSVRMLLMNPRNAAIRTLRGEEVGVGNWPAIVPEDTLRAVQELLSGNAAWGPGSASKHLGTSLFRCFCGELVNCAPVGPKRADGTKARKYRCAGPVGHMCRAADPVEKMVEAYVVARLADPRLIERVTPSSDNETNALRRELKTRRSDLAAFERDAADDADADYAMVKRMTKTKKAKIAELLSKLSVTSAASAIAKAAADANPVAYYQAADLSTRRAIIADLCTVTLLRSDRRGRVPFDRSLVVIEPVAETESVAS